MRRPARSIAGGLVASVLALCARILELFAQAAERVQAFLSWTVSSGLLGRVGRGLKSGVVGLFQGLGILTERMLPEPRAAPTTMETAYDQPLRRVTTAREDGGSRLPLIVVFVIITLVAAVSLSLVLRRQSRENQFSQLFADATAALDVARSSQDTGTVELQLGEASDLVDQALRIKPTHEEAIALRNEILLAVDEARQVLRLQFSAQASLPGPPSQPHRLLLHENELYVLDAGTPELRMYQVDEINGIQEPPGGSVLLSPDSGPAGVDVQELTDLAWIGSGSGREIESLLLLVNGSSLLQLDEAQGFAPVSVADSEIWNEPRAIGGYSGYLYVLDAADDRILKYAPTENTYDSFPLSYFQGETAVELENAVDMAIDGYIYILTGKDILKFSGGLQVDFSVTGLGDQGLQDPTAIFADPDTQYLYVADAGLARIVQLTKEGVFVRQFLPPREDEALFQGVQDVWVDELQGELVVLTSDGLFLAPLEQVPSALE
jgi:type II secretory pathway pseudopilin PulG